MSVEAVTKGTAGVSISGAKAEFDNTSLLSADKAVRDAAFGALVEMIRDGGAVTVGTLQIVPKLQKTLTDKKVSHSSWLELHISCHTHSP